MRESFITILLVSTLLVGCRSSSTTPAEESRLSDEEKALQGVWNAVYAERLGRPLSIERVGRMKIVFQDDTLRLIDGSADAEAANYELDAAQEPAAIDIIIRKGPDRGKRAPGIYEIAGDTLEICWAEPGKPRPTEFTTENKHASEYIRLRRAK